MLSARYGLRSPTEQDKSNTIITRTYKVIGIDPHPRKKILIIHGDLEITVQEGVMGQVIAEEKSELKKQIHLDNLNPSTSTAVLVTEIFDQCPFLTENWTETLTICIEFLKNRPYNARGLAVIETHANQMFDDEDFEDALVNGGGAGDVFGTAELPNVTMDSLDLYVELLYEEIQDKIKGAKALVKLTMNSENLVIIFNHDTALNAIFRTIREDHKKSLELTSYLLNILLSFSKFYDFHPILIGNKICSLTITIIEFEINRYERWSEEIMKRENSINEAEESDDISEVNQKSPSELQKMKHKFFELIKKQEGVFTIGFQLVHQLAETPALRREICEAGMLRLLISVLDRTKNQKLLLAIVSFLRDLSGYVESKQEMGECEIVHRITSLLIEPNLVGITSSELTQTILELLYNLTFSSKLRGQILRGGLLIKIGHFFDSFPQISTLISYNFSMDHHDRPKFLEVSGLVEKFVDRLLSSPKPQTELAALVLNLAWSKRCSILIANNGRLRVLINLGIKTKDVVIMKILRKLSEHPISLIRNQLHEQVHVFISSIEVDVQAEFAMEVFGILGNLNPVESYYGELIQGTRLIDYMRQVLSLNFGKHSDTDSTRTREENLALEIIMFLGTMSAEPASSDFLVEQGFVDLLLNLGTTPGIDSDIRTQIFYVFYHMTTHTKTRYHIVEKTKVPQLIILFLHSDVQKIRDVAENVWNNFGEHNEEWRQKVKMERFLVHNAQWFEITNLMDSLTLDPETLERYRNQPLEVDFPKSGKSARTSQSAYNKSQRELSTSMSTTSDSQYSEDGEDSEENDSSSTEEEGPILTVNKRKSGSSKSDTDGEPNIMTNIFDQFKYQFNQEMIGRDWRHLESTDDDAELGIMYEDDDDDDASDDFRPASTTTNRPKTGRVRPESAAHQATASKRLTPPIHVKIRPKD